MAFWTPEHEKLLAKLWAEEYSGTEIAREIMDQVGPLPRVTKNGEPKKINRDMVIAKARRMGLERRPSPLGQRPENVS